MVSSRGATDADDLTPARIAGVRAASAGVSIDLEVTPGASARAFPAGYNAWRERVEIRVTAPPENGKANEDVIEAIAAFFEVPLAHVVITSGHKDRRKSALIVGLGIDTALTRLHAELAQQGGT